MATRDGSDPALKFHPVDSPAAAPIGIHLRTSKKRQNAANLCVFAHLQQASQASDVGSIPIARSNVPRRPNGAVGGWNNAAAD